MMRPFLLLLLAWPMSAQEPAPPATQEPAAKPAEAIKPPAAEAPPRHVAFVNGHLWPVRGGRPGPGTLILRNDKIAVVGPPHAPIPEGAEVVDCRGRHVVPGFVAVAARGCLGVRGNTVKEKAKDRLDPWTDYMLMALGSGITTAHQGPGGQNELMGGVFGPQGVFAGTPRGVVGGVVAKLCYGTLEGFEVRDPAAVYMSIEGASGNEELEAAEALRKARELHEKKRAWIEELRGGNKESKEPKGDEAAEALVRCIAGEIPLFMQASKRVDLLKAAELSERFGIPMVLTPATEAWTAMPELGRRQLTLVLCHRGLGGRSTRPYRDRWKDADHGWSLETAAIAGRTGVPWATTTLSTGIVTGLLAGRDLLGLVHEAAFAVRGGAGEDEALASITLVPARILGIADRVGSLEEGKDADVLVMDRPPLDYRSFVDLAYVNGELRYDRRQVPFWSHVPTDRRAPPRGEWHPYGIWDLTHPLPDSARPEGDTGGAR
jgi:imidazolonepropionase-like amidohydrolase